MLTSRGQENLVRTRPTAGKALQPKTPGNFQTPQATNRAPLGAKTTNAKAKTVLKDKNDTKASIFQTPVPGHRNHKSERTANRPSSGRRSGRSKISVATTTESEQAIISAPEIADDDEPDFGYAPPPPVELPDPPMEFGYDETFPQFRPENMFRGYGEIYLGSPKDESGMSIRLKKEEEEDRKFREQEEQELLEKIRRDMSRPLILSDDEVDNPHLKLVESKPDTLRTRSAALALSGVRVPAAANKQTTSSRLKMVKPIAAKETSSHTVRPATMHRRPLSVSQNTIGFPKAKKAPSIIAQRQKLFSSNSDDDIDDLADELSDFEFLSADLSDDDNVFQLPMLE